MIRVAHVGAWGRNWGDRALLLAQQRLLRERMPPGSEVEFVRVDCQGDVPDPDEYDAYWVGGGGLIMDRSDAESDPDTWQWHGGVDRIPDDVPLIVQGIGLNTFPADDGYPGPAVRADLERVEARATMRSVRNHYTHAHMPDPDAWEVVPDAALWARATEVTSLPGHGSAVPVIGVAWAGDRPERRWGSVLSAMEATERIAREVAVVAEEIGAVVVLLPNVPEEDWTASGHLRDAARDRYLNPLDRWPVLADTNSDVGLGHLLSLYARCSVVLGYRKHGCLLAMAQGVPAIPMGGQAEVTAMVEAIVGDASQDGDALSDRIRALASRTPERRAYLDTMRAAMTAARAGLDDWHDDVARALTGSGS